MASIAAGLLGNNGCTEAVFAAGGEYGDSRMILQWMDPWPLCNFCVLFLSWWNHSNCIFQCTRICPWQASSGVRTNLPETWDSTWDNGREVLRRLGIWILRGITSIRSPEIGPGPSRLFCSDRLTCWDFGPRHFLKFALQGLGGAIPVVEKRKYAGSKPTPTHYYWWEQFPWQTLLGFQAHQWWT